MLDDVCAQGTHCGVLFPAVPMWHDNNRPEASLSGGKGHTLAMIAASSGDDTRYSWVAFYQVSNIENAAAHFERAQWRVIFVFYPNLSANTLAQQGRPDLRGGRDYLVN